MISFLSNIYDAIFGKLSEQQQKNRTRFDTVISDTRFNYLEPIFQNFEAGVQVSDAEALDAYEKFSGSIYSNTVSMAELHLVVVATIAAYKPHLAEDLLERPLLYVYLSFGEAVNNEVVVQFVANRILAKDADPYCGIPNKKARRWLKVFFPKNKELVEAKLKEVIAKNEEEDA
jgi:hypothetical protein